MSDTLGEFVVFFKDRSGEVLDFSLEFLDIVENWIIKNFGSKEELLLEENKVVLNMLAVYIGEVFREKLGAKWFLDIEDESSAYFRLPILKGDRIASPIAPHTLATACISRKKGNYISKILERKLK